MAFPLSDVRRRCHEVITRATHVYIDLPRLREYAAALTALLGHRPSSSPSDTYEGELEDVAAYVLTLDAINFGSGYSPWLTNKRENSLYYTVASGLRDRFVSSGPFNAGDLARLTISDVKAFIPIQGEPTLVGELLRRFTEALNELGRFTLTHFDGALPQIVRAANGSVQGLVDLLTQMPSFDDVASYHGVQVPFYKRAQLVAADLWIRIPGTAYGDFHDVQTLTAFADNAVPHVLRTDGVLVYDEHLERLIAGGTVLRPGSPEEIEIRAGTVAAIDSIVEAIRPVRPDVNDVAIDVFLWTRGHDPAYATQPRHLTQTIFY